MGSSFDFNLLNKEHVKMRNRDIVEEKIKKLVAAGQDDISLIIDFDRTITKGHHEGKRCQSTYGVITSSTIMGEDFKTRCEANDNIYYPIEIDPNRTVEEKMPLMVEWFEKNTGIIKEHKVHRDQLSAMVKDAFVAIRDGFNEMMQKLDAAEVPVLIYSAGLGDIVLAIIQKDSKHLPNMHLVSNMLSFTSEGYVSGIEGELVHMFNKNMSSLTQHPLYPTLMKKQNCVVLGDMLGDANMSDGLNQTDNILKIGFLNDKIEERLPGFLESFDIVLVDDQTMCLPGAVVDAVLKHSWV